MHRSFLALALSAACLLSGCGDSSVADGIAQRDANEIVATLRARGIEASTEKERGSKGRYTVSVPSDRFGEAAATLTELGLPADQKLSFGELLAPSGLLPSSREVEALRLDRAAAAEIEALLSQHPVVSSAGVILRLRAAQPGESPAVSVVIQKRAGELLDESALRSIVVRAVPGIRPEGVVMIVAEQRPPPPVADESDAGLVPFLVFWRVAHEDYGGLSLLLLGLLLGIAGLAGLAGYIYGQYNLSRHTEVVRADGLEGGRIVPTIAGPLKRDLGGEGNEGGGDQA